MNQYVHLLSNTYVNQPHGYLGPGRSSPSDEFPLHPDYVGLYYNLKRMYDFSIEGYYKRLNNLIDYKIIGRFETIFSPVGKTGSVWER